MYIVIKVLVNNKVTYSLIKLVPFINISSIRVIIKKFTEMLFDKFVISLPYSYSKQIVFPKYYFS